MNQIPRFNILGVGVHQVTLPQVLAQISVWIADRQPVYVSTCNVYTVMMSRQEPTIRQAINQANLVLPDGMPLAWLSRRQSSTKVDRITGADLMLTLSRLSGELGYTHYFSGGQPGVAAELARRLQANYPGLKVVGTWTPPLRPLFDREEAEIIEQINRANPDIIWVGLGGPKQDIWMADHRIDLTASVLIGVGAAFDFQSGRIPRAPRWLQQLGLEWLFRLGQEPRRLWRRYLLYNLLFIILVFFQNLKSLFSTQ